MMILKQKGQATLEYIMLFTVVIFIAGGLMFQFNDAFKNFVNNYFGAYLSCLLESGELPSLGWEPNGSNDANGDDSCESDFQPFNLASGRMPIRGNFGTPRGQVDSVVGQGGSIATPAGKRDATAGNKESSASGARSEVASANISGPRGEGGGGGSGGRFGDSSGGRQSPVPLNQKESNEGMASVETSGGDQVAIANRNKVESGRTPYVPLSRFEDDDLGEKKARKNIPAPGEGEKSVRRVPAEDGKRKKASTTGDDGFDFSDFIKYLLIFGIILAMLIFLGGQAMQISKSQEK